MNAERRTALGRNQIQASYAVNAGCLPSSTAEPLSLSRCRSRSSEWELELHDQRAVTRSTRSSSTVSPRLAFLIKDVAVGHVRPATGRCTPTSSSGWSCRSRSRSRPRASRWTSRGPGPRSAWPAVRCRRTTYIIAHAASAARLGTSPRHSLTVNIEPLNVGDALLAKDLKLPEGVSLVTPGETPICHVMGGSGGAAAADESAGDGDGGES